MPPHLPWLHIIGINENGLSGLSDAAKSAISGASLVAGGKRHLELAKDQIKGETLPWPSPPHDAIPRIIAQRPQPVCVLTSGDPFFYGMGAVLARHISPQEMHVLPAPSIASMVAARMGWAQQHMVTVGINGRPLERLIPHLQPNARILVLSADETSPASVASLLNERNMGDARMHLIEHLGGPKESIRSATAADFTFSDIARLNCLALEIPEIIHAIPLVPGLADDWFDHDGQMTKREVRAVTLSALAPRKGELLWDVGLGSGSIAIEWLLAHPENRAIGFEKHPDRATRAAKNAKHLGVPQLVVLEGEAPLICEDLESPDAIFIGGGATNPGMLEFMWNALKPGGRLVINAISLETEALQLAAHKHYGGTLIRIGIERAEAVGTMTGWRPAMRVTQWSITK